MSFALRLATCVFAVLSLSVLAAWAWDASDPAAAAAAVSAPAAESSGR